ncbi:MAG TPA: hypothetical protein VHX63_10245 [Acidobacteriaceae bacterium]|jgi:hypothetical protein|nr:hypothetical protein [Acidobacteriaceae bacterium]
MNRKAIVALLLALAFCATGWGLEKPDFSGTWKLNVDKSDYGDLQGPSSRTDTIEERDGEIRESVISEGRRKTQKYVLRFSTDGRKTILPAGDGIRIPPVTLHSISATWQGNSLVVVEGLTHEGSDIVAKYAYTLSPDENILTMTVSLNGGAPAATFVFDKVKE